MRVQVLPISSLNGHSNVILVFHQLKLGKLPTPTTSKKQQNIVFPYFRDEATNNYVVLEVAEELSTRIAPHPQQSPERAHQVLTCQYNMSKVVLLLCTRFARQH